MHMQICTENMLDLHFVTAHSFGLFGIVPGYSGVNDSDCQKGTSVAIRQSRVVITWGGLSQ